MSRSRRSGEGFRTATPPASVQQLADAFFGAFLRRDASTLEELYAPDFVMRSPAGVRRGADHLEMLRAGKVTVRELRYEDVVRHVFDGGFVQQHLVSGVLPSGRELRMRACLVVLVVDEPLHRARRVLRPVAPARRADVPGDRGIDVVRGEPD